jgi:6-pyruvoyltetrahydropterin/6-carboxytetrahydropterin synthase
VEGDELDSAGLLMDFGDVRAAIKALVDRLDHQFLNDLPPFNQINPSAENLAHYFCDSLQPQVQKEGLRVQAVTVWETDATSATFRP